MITESQLKARSKQFALDVIKFVDTLPRDRVCDHVGRQLLRSATSVGANYRAACRAKSGADMAHKVAICEEEADESGFWLELLEESGRVRRIDIEALRSESDQFVAMLVASRKTIRTSIAKGLLKEDVSEYHANEVTESSLS